LPNFENPAFLVPWARTLTLIFFGGYFSLLPFMLYSYIVVRGGIATYGVKEPHQTYHKASWRKPQAFSPRLSCFTQSI